MKSDTIKEASNDLSRYKILGMNIKGNHFKNWFSSGLMNEFDEFFISKVQDFWEENYDRKIDPSLHTAFMNLTNKKEPRLIPARIMQREILPVLNDYTMSHFYGDKNLYDIIINPTRSVETVLRNINGSYFDSNHKPVKTSDVMTILLNGHPALIIKPSKTNNGNGIKKIEIKDKQIYLNKQRVTVEDLEEIYHENFIIQKELKQHPNLAAPHPASVNTLRMVTFRWKNEIKYLLAFARFGSNDDIRDNANVDTSPRVGISDTGEFFHIGISHTGQRFTHHPSTGFCFADLKPIPNFDEFKQFVIDCHKKILHLNFISWDIVVGIDGKPIFLEANFAGSTSFYQLVAQKSMFGDLTEEVLNYVRDEHKVREPVLMSKHRRKIEEREKRKQENLIIKYKKRVSELKKKNKKLEKSKLKLEKEIVAEQQKLLQIERSHKRETRKLKKQYNNVVNSKSYRYTKPLRKIMNWFN